MPGHPHRGPGPHRHHHGLEVSRVSDPAAEADAAAKLYAAGILPLETIWADLGYTPQEIETMRRQNVRQALDTTPLALPAAPAIQRTLDAER